MRWNFWLIQLIGGSIYYGDIWEYKFASKSWFWLGGEQTTEERKYNTWEIIFAEHTLPLVRGFSASAVSPNNDGFWFYGGFTTTKAGQCM